MAWLILLCSLLLAALDYAVAKSMCGDNRRTLKRCLTILWTIDFMPQIFTAITFIAFRDNPTWLSNLGSWILYLYMIVALSRGPFNLLFVLSKSKALRLLGIVTGVAIVLLLIYSASVTRTDYQINRVVIESPRVSQNLSGYKIVQLSDLHVGAMVNPEKELADIASICNNENPDLLVLCGDLIDIRHEELTLPIKEQLRKLKAKDGIYSVIGNHDVGVYIKDSITFTPDNNTRQLILQQQELGWRLLDNCSDKIYHNGDSIYITGITYKKELQDHRHSRKLPEFDIAAAYKDVSEECFSITLSHIPQLWDNILEETKSDLTLAGHVHSMQIKLPIGERGISPAMLLYKRWSGLYEENGRWLYINDGVGYAGFPMRIGARPEITVFELQHCDN